MKIFTECDRIDSETEPSGTLPFLLVNSGLVNSCSVIGGRSRELRRVQR
ncbi:hypothetical protein H6G95_05925 [Nostoc linckia FACHB-391]|uniref:Uncharacterized protein n=1 Tax=Nostoc linckia FACHB-391 TaxID=2692906 RepID=A0ABR8ES08_NOSLI|nr:hypothetical protein [Nostoc linckia FACHB-391]